jgi:hypothetical protein
MEIKLFASSEEAIWAVAKNHRCFQLYPHALEAGDEAGLHYHLKAREWLIATHGSFAVRLDGHEQVSNLKEGPAVLIHFPPKSRHSLKALSKLRYFVLRDRRDRNIYVRS